MGARQSRRSVDITTTPKKEGLPAEGGVGDAAAPGDGKLERIEETDTKPTTNGIAPHTDVAEDKDKDKDDATEKEKDKEKQEEVKVEETISAAESPTETAEVTTPTEANPASPNTATSPDNKETKKKEKMKKKWSFRSISFSKKDKNKPAREEAPKNGDVTKEEPLAEGGEEAENGSPTAGSPVEEKSAVSSPTAENEAAPVAAAPAAAATVAATATAATATAAAAATAAPATESKEESAASAASSPTEEKTEEPTPSAPTPVPVEEKKEEVEKVEAEKKVVEVSPAGGQFVPDPVEVSVFRVQTVATPSIIERKTSEDIPSLPPSSPPPTPIDSSPLQQAQQAAATATALAEALKLPAEAADKDLITPSALSSRCPERNDPSTPAAESLDTTPHRPPSSPVLQPRTGSTLAPPSVEALPVVDTDAPNPPTPTTNNVESLSAGHVTVTELHDSKIANTDTHDPPSLLPTERPESPSCKANVVDQQRVKEIPLPEKSNLVDEMSTKADATLKSPTPNAAVEQLSQVTRVCDPSGARASESEACEDVVESVTKEIIVECESKKIPGPVDVKERVKEELVEEVIEPNEVVQEEIERVEEAVVDPPVPTIDAIVESEEGPIPASDETLVEAKPAVVIPEDEDMPETVENLVITVADTSRVDSEPVEVMAMVEDKLETETESDVAMPTEEILVCEVAKESKDPFVPNEATFAPIQPVNDPIIENIVDKLIDVPELTRSEEEPMPPPLPESPVPISRDKFDPESVNVALDSNTVPSLVVDVKPPILDVGNAQEIDGCPLSLPEQQSTAPNEFPDFSVPLADDVSLITLDVSSLNLMDEKEACLTSETQTRFSSCRLEEVPSPTDDLPPAPEDTVQQHTDSFKYPLPPEELSCPLNASEMNSELPVAVENAPSLRNPTETLPISPRTPSPVSNVSITSGLTASTKDSSQTLLYDDQSNREFKMESVSISLNSYNESDIELKERLAESLAETEKQEESSVSCQLSNNATSSTTIQETHQSTPEPEAPVENNVAADTTTESSGEAIVKVTTPAVPSEVPATLVPSSPAITEDVASVAMAIEEMDICDKAIAAATIECNTNEIIAEARYQNNINE
ncbi:PREDICTED: calphotin-like [Eufriesea mexicana]|uniref:calphotin-like n=1 Tax=Eufriesea mexicana TaxID=516756 RepID=UPI00083BC11A|nr:PREDICTED: calphotin-like [Eufriesea mexicana]